MKKNKSAMVINDALTALFNSAVMLKNAIRQFFRNKNITEAQFHVLWLLKSANHPLTQKELSEALLVDKSNLTGLVDRMERAGHLRRKKAEHDRRSYDLLLTAEAEKLFEELLPSYQELLSSIMTELPPEELVLLTGMLNKLQKSLDNRCPCSQAAASYLKEYSHEQ